MDTTRFPHNEGELRAALSRLPKSVSERAAALHLALPVGAAPGIAVRLNDEWMRYRDHEVRLSGDPVADAARVALLGHEEGDEYLDLSAEPVEWAKLVHSGVNRIMFGTDTLFGLPLLSVDPRVPESAGRELLARWLEDGMVEGLVELASGAFQAIGADRGYLLRPAIMPRQETSRVVSEADLERAAQGVADEISGELVDVELVEVYEQAVELDVQVRLEHGWSATVPVRVTPTSETVGIATEDIDPGKEELLPIGWTWKGRTGGGGLIGQHRSSLTTALLSYGE